jgi:hypothetical protein
MPKSRYVYDDHFVDAIKEYMREGDVSQSVLASSTGVAQSRISTILGSDSGRILERTARRLATLLPKEFEEYIANVPDISKGMGFCTVAANAVNRGLGALVEILKHPDIETSPKFTNPVISINDSLYEAIDTFSPYVNSVVVRLSVDFTTSLEKEMRDRRRKILRTFVCEIDENADQMDDHYSLELAVPLPYFFSAGSHGSDQRASENASFDNLVLKQVRKEDRNYSTFLRVNVGSTVGLEKVNGAFRAVERMDIDFPIAEIDSIEFATTDDGSLTPVFDCLRGFTYAPRSSNSHHNAYLAKKELYTDQ